MNTNNSLDRQDEQWMERALSLAKKAEQLGEVPVGAVIVDSTGNIVGEGWNQPISLTDPTAHAEIMALREAAQRLQNYRLPDCTLYVTIEPCCMCAGAIVHSRIKRLVFGALEPKAGSIVSQMQLLDSASLNHSVAYTGAVCAEDASAMMSAFFQRRRLEKKEKMKSDKAKSL